MKVSGFAPFVRGSYVREFDHSIIQFAREDVGLCSFYDSYLKQLKLFSRKLPKTILKNHLGFTTNT